MSDDQSLRRSECYNLFVQKKDTVLTWDEVVRETARLFGRTRDEVFETMNQLIDSGKIECPVNEKYCLPGVHERVSKQQAQEAVRSKVTANAKTLSRKEFDLLHPYDQSAYIKNGGKIA